MNVNLEIEKRNRTQLRIPLLAALAVMVPYQAQVKHDHRPSLTTPPAVPFVSNFKQEVLRRNTDLIRFVLPKPTHERPLKPKHESLKRYAASLIIPAVYKMWLHTGMCETHLNFKAQGPTYEGAFGIYYQNWDHYGGLQFASNAGNATPAEQMLVGSRILYNQQKQFNIPLKQWIDNGGARFSLSPELASRDQKMIIEEAITKNVPDQHGCNPAGW